MKQVRRLLSLVIALTMAFGVFAFTAQAKSKAAPLSLKVEVSSFESGYSGIITVAVTVKNTSGKDLKNIVVTSCGSKGLCMYRPIDYNVVISNPGEKPVIKKNAIAACLKSGGTMKYVYCVLLGYQTAKTLVPEAARIIMLEQHRLLGTKNFRKLSFKANYQECKGNLCFGDIKTVLDVKAFYNVSKSAYEKIEASANTAADTSAKVTATRSASSSSSGAQTRAAASGSKASSSSASAAVVNAAKKVAEKAAEKAISSAASKTASKGSVRTFVTNPVTKIYHTKNCGHWPSDNKVNREATAEQLESEGYTLCEFCAAAK